MQIEGTKLDLSQPKQALADERLRNDVMIWLGTVRPDGRPHLVPVWFLYDGEMFLILSKDDQKIRNLKQNANVMLALDDTKIGENVVLVEGLARLHSREDADPLLPAYAEKYARKLAEYGWTMEWLAENYPQRITITPTRFRVF